MTRTTPPSLSDEQRKAFYDALDRASKSGRLAAPGAVARFDGAAAWARLEPEPQAAIGAAALELVVARQGMDLSSDMREEALFECAEAAAGRHLEERAVEHLLDTAAIPRNDVPPLPSLVGRICARCGATEHDACWTPPWADWSADGTSCPQCEEQT